METTSAMTDQPWSDSPIPMNGKEMIKEETVKDDGRTLIYYTFPDDQDVPSAPATQEAAHV